MFKFLAVMLLSAIPLQASDLPTRKYLDLAAIKTMVAASEAKAKELNVSVSICIVDESGNLLFFERGETASLNTIEFAQRKARDAAFYGSPSKDARRHHQERQCGGACFSPVFPQSGRPSHQDRRSNSGRHLRQRGQVRDRRADCAGRPRRHAEEIGQQRLRPTSR